MGRRSWAAGLTAAAALAAVPATADAAGLATAPATTGAATATWSAVLADSTGALQTGKPLGVSWGLLDSAPRYASVRNNGTVALTGETFQVTATLATVRLDACVGATWTGGTCAGSVVTLTDSTSGPTAVTRALATGAQLSLRLTPSSLLGLATASVTVSVTRAQARAATTSNS